MNNWKFKDRAEVAQAIKDEGLEYFVTGYSQSTQMPDEELEKIFEKAAQAYEDFKEVLEELAESVGIKT